jgi:hypothetical protein
LNRYEVQPFPITEVAVCLHLTKINTRKGENKTSGMHYFAKMSIHPDEPFEQLEH